MYHLLILDESGSMHSIQNGIINSMKEIIQDIQRSNFEYPDLEHFVSLISFNSSGIKAILDKASVSRMSEIDLDTYKPQGGTPLYDAMGKSLILLKQHLFNREDNHVSVTILTDGEENASREFNSRDIRILVQSLKELGWEFVYIGTEHDVLRVSKDLAIDNCHSFHKSEAGLNKVREENRLFKEAMYLNISKGKKM